MTTTLVLTLPDFNQPFVVETNACDTGIWVVLMQQGRPLAFISKKIGVIYIRKRIASNSYFHFLYFEYNLGDYTVHTEASHVLVVVDGNQGVSDGSTRVLRAPEELRAPERSTRELRELERVLRAPERSTWELRAPEFHEGAEGTREGAVGAGVFHEVAEGAEGRVHKGTGFLNGPMRHSTWTYTLQAVHWRGLGEGLMRAGPVPDYDQMGLVRTPQWVVPQRVEEQLGRVRQLTGLSMMEGPR
ncbi:hypothetical protein LWI28_016820 [Acer negundo]|uniref:Reverse transcriptase/retrotransposon-derived protein RNase H-like domain-containing protein n=1 Tax=Acer negundo TaxID=4023 RepID=A0AAD5IAJ1_ACENE|nr:hypothetical protein LWI28_016820 [Acer negundo]